MATEYHMSNDELANAIDYAQQRTGDSSERQKLFTKHLENLLAEQHRRAINRAPEGRTE